MPSILSSTRDVRSPDGTRKINLIKVFSFLFSLFFFSFQMMKAAYPSLREIYVASH